jgi:hypothetical protein
MAINIHLRGSLKRSIPGLSVLWCTSDVTGQCLFTRDTTLLAFRNKICTTSNIHKGRSQECLTTDIPGHFFPYSNTFNQHMNSAKFISLEKCVTSRGEKKI